MGWMAGDSRQYVGQPSLRVDVVELGGRDQAVEERRPMAAAVGAGEQPGAPPQSQATQGSFRGVVREADPAVVEEAGEGGPALEHVVDVLISAES